MTGVHPGSGDAMVRHIDNELKSLKDLVLQMGGYVESTLDASTTALLRFSKEIVESVQALEKKINELQIQIDEECVNFLAMQAPVARQLRLVIAIVKINTDLERMGDQCVNITISALEYSKAESQDRVPANLLRMITEVKNIVHSALDAFARQDVELAEHVLTLDDQIDELKEEIIRLSLEKMEQAPHLVRGFLSLIMTARNLERLADHATNIAEEVIYLATGADVRHGHVKSSS